MIEHAHEFCSDWPLLTLSNRCLNFLANGGHVFEICKCPYKFCSPLTEICIPNFKLIGPMVYRYSFPIIIAPPSGKAAQFFLFDQKYVIISSRVWWRYLIPFKSYSSLSKIGPASFDCFYAPFKRESKFQLFFNDYDIHSREHFCSGLVPIGEKPRTSSQK